MGAVILNEGRKVNVRRFFWLVPVLLLTLAASASANSEAKSGYFTTSDGVRLHYVEAGSGPAIVFVPGWTNSAWIWEPQIQHFSKEVPGGCPRPLLPGPPPAGELSGVRPWPKNPPARPFLTD